jgi:Calcineurin-like phosphoesterase/Purple acid Phosphatase, N-terminal domain
MPDRPGSAASSGDTPSPPAESGLARRDFMRLAGLTGAALAAAPLLGRTDAAAAETTRSGPTLVRQPALAGAPPAEQLHLQFTADASRGVVASWVTPVRVARPQLRLGTPHDGFGRTVDAEERVYVEGISGQTVYTYHASMEHLRGDTDYTYEVFAAGAPPVAGSFHTSPRQRQRFRFTSFGDQSIPARVGPGAQPGPWTPNAGFVVDAVESQQPLFHLLNGDLCYANVSDDPVATWTSFFNNNMRSARNRPWMPAAGNHENEVGNGPQGLAAYQTRFFLPDNGQPADFQGNWYTFRVGSLAVVSINNDDVCIQAGSFSQFRLDHLIDPKASRGDYVRGYSHGAQHAWLEATLARWRSDPRIDWIAVCMHQVAMSSAHFNGADLGIRQEWLPLFDRYGVDLVVAGHEHHFERSHAVRGPDNGPAAPDGQHLLTPLPRTSATDVVDTTKGAVHLIIGGGGHSTPTPPSAFDMPHDGVVIYNVTSAPNGSHPALTTTEPGDWSAVRDLLHPYGFCVFDLDPGPAGGTTSITVTYHATTAGSADYSQVVDSFTLVRARRHDDQDDRDDSGDG